MKKIFTKTTEALYATLGNTVIERMAKAGLSIEGFRFSISKAFVIILLSMFGLAGSVYAQGDPTVTTQDVINITSSSAQVIGRIDLYPVLAKTRMVEYRLAGETDILGTIAATSTAALFQVTVTGLTPNTKYEARAYVTFGEGGKSSGAWHSFKTLAPIYYTVTFNPDGGTVSPTSKSVLSGSAVGTLPVPVKPGYSFMYWYTAVLDWTETTIVTENATLIPRWKKEEVVVTRPTLSAVTISDITATSAKLTCTITNNGGSSITKAEFDYGKDSDGRPLQGTKAATISGSTFTATLTGLSPGTKYAVEGYAWNSGFASAGGSGEKTFTTTIAKPVITSHPSNTSVTAGETATFSVTATGATSYQWQTYVADIKTWVDIPDMSGITGATTAKLSMVTSNTINGSRFRCKVSNDAGSVNSNSATLTVTVATVSVTGVSLNKTSLALKEGESETLTETVSPATATNKGVTWKSSNTAVATVDASGKVTAVKAGSASITVTTNDGAKTATCAVTVTDAGVTPTITSANNTSAVNGTGGTFTATATGTGPFTWSLSGQPAGVSINTSTGVITIAPAVATGTHTFSVKVNGAKGHDVQSFTLTVSSVTIAVSGVSLNKTSLTLDEGTSETLTETIIPAAATNRNITWKSSNTAVATVDAWGTVTAVRTGLATITVTTVDGGKTATCAITVQSPVANESIDKIAVWATGSQVHIRLHTTGTVRIYNLMGTLIKSIPLAIGELSISLPRGIYIVRTDTVSKKVVVK